MTTGDTKVFLNREKLIEMTNLRRIGWGLTSLAIYFNCDFSSIRFQCDKYGIEPLDLVFTFEHLTKPIIERFEAKFNDDHINRGKSYKEYLLEAGYNPEKIKYAHDHIFAQRR